MAVIRKVVVTWNGFPGSPGYSVFYSPEATDAVASIKTFFDSLKVQGPPGLSWAIPFAGDSIQDTNGALASTWTSPDGGTVTATGAGNYAAGTGAFVRWLTAGVVNRRRVRGHTFFCPIVANSYESNGSLSSSAVTAFSAAAAVLGAASKLVIWARPFDDPTGASPHRDGSSHAVIAGQCPDQVTSLRSRRS